MGDYAHILRGLPVMFLIEAVAMVVVIIAIGMDLMFGWRKAKIRGEARTSYAFSRTITKFALYEGVMLICLGIDTLIHFVWAQFADSVHCVPLSSVLAAVVLCVVEIWSMHEKADEKTRHNVEKAIKIVAEALPREDIKEIAKAALKNDGHEVE